MTKGRLIIFSAPSGAGKTTIVKHLLNAGLPLEFSISACSRPKRHNEVDGKDYYFLSTDEFKKRITENEFIEWEEVYQNQYYGTLKSELERIWSKQSNVIFDVDVIGGLNIKKQYPEKALSIFIMPPSVEELENRLKKRSSDSDVQIRKRIAKAAYELAYADKFDKIIVNNSLKEAVQEAHKHVSEFLKQE